MSRSWSGAASSRSVDGLVLTNHHVVVGELQKLSTPDDDLVAGGFFARSRDEERRCAGLELYQLQSFENVTGRIAGAIEAGEDAHEARRAAISTLTGEETERTGPRCEVVTLYQGRVHP